MAARKAIDHNALIWRISPLIITYASPEAQQAVEEQIAGHLKFINEVRNPGGISNDKFEHLRRHADGQIITGYQVTRGNKRHALHWNVLQEKQQHCHNRAFDLLKRLNSKELVDG